MPAAKPMMSAPCASTKPDAGVIATRPATAPEIMPRTLGFLAMIHSMNIQPSAAAAVAICVAAAAMPALTFAVTAEPALKPNQPTHISGAETDALTEHKAGDKRRGARVQMHDGAASVIKRAQRTQPAAAPHPM